MSRIFPQWLADQSHRLDPYLISLLKKEPNYLRYFSTSPLDYPFLSNNRSKRVPLLIQFHTKSNYSVCQKKLKEYGFTPEQHFENIHTDCGPTSLANLPKLLSLPEVKKVYLDRPVTTLLNTATPTTRATQSWSKLKTKGEGTTIAIIDTGISPHPDISARIIGFRDLINNKRKPYDDNGHGTHCAGCAAGNGAMSSRRYCGSAPKASLVGVKVLDKKGSGSLSKVISGVQWCIKNKKKYNIRVISLSLGSVAQLPYSEDPICQIVEHAWRNGIVVVVAAGNNGPKGKTISSPGNHPSVITVGATDTQNTVDPSDDKIALFSSRGPTLDGISKPDIVAPGANIISLRSQNSYLDRYAENRVGKYYYTMSGTSMATPLVAGVAALIISKNPNITPSEVKRRLTKGAESLRYSSSSQGSGQINAEKSLSNKYKKK